MTRRTPPVVVGYTAGQAASGRWWVTCPRPACDFYRGGLTEAQAKRLGEFHDDMHRRGQHPDPLRRDEASRVASAES